MKHGVIFSLILTLAGCVGLPRTTPPTPALSVFVVAHPDDWQLFMNPDAFHAMNEAHEKAVFVHVSAGDAGRGTGGEPTPYYLAREEGAMRAIRFMANAANATAALGIDTKPEAVERAGHKVARHTYANAVAYFLRIHDGNIVTGNDFQEHPLSLQRLRSGASAETKAIDGSARYVGWNDFVATLEALIASELAPGTALNVHIAELDERRNPGDHPDHRAVAFAMEEVVARLPCARVSRHQEYATRDRRLNVPGVNYMIDVGTWAATASGLSDNHAGSTWEPGHNAWLGRDYHRTQEPRGTCGTANAQTTPVTVHADRVVGEIRPIWNYFGYDEAGTTLTREGRDLLGKLNALSHEPIRIRVHHLLTSGDGTLALKWSSTNVYTEDAAGNPRYDWTRLDAIMDELSRPGIEPFVQASFMPQALSSKPEPYTPVLVKTGLPRDMVSGGAFYPPKDYRKWEALIEAWARHSGERYGVDRASSWLWELWNEPESPYWRGTPEEFFRLYDHFAAAVKRALPKARVGGPHVTDPGWKNGDAFMRAFLEHCRSGKNSATGGKGAPLDFVAFHAKGTTRLDDKRRVEMNLRNHLKTIDTYGRIIASFPEFARLPVYIGESDPEGCAGCPATLDPERDYRRTSQFAAYTAASFMRKQDLLARTGGNLQGAVSWAFTFAEQPWFNGLRALTTNEVALPVLNTFELFARLGRKRVAVDAPSMIPVDAIIADGVRGEPDLGAIASVDETRSRLTILLWNYHDVAGGYDDRREVQLTLSGLGDAARETSAVEYTVDENSANAYTAWLAMGSPQPPNADQIAKLHAAARLQASPRKLTRTTAGNAQLRLVMPRQSVKLIEVELTSPQPAARR